jgi:hypothetical protein
MSLQPFIALEVRAVESMLGRVFARSHRARAGTRRLHDEADWWAFGDCERFEAKSTMGFFNRRAQRKQRFSFFVLRFLRSLLFQIPAFKLRVGF